MATEGKSSYCLTDATGNVLGLVDVAGKRTHTYAYSPAGLPRDTTTKQPRSRLREARGLPSPPAKEDQVNGFGLVVLIVVVAAVAALGMWLQGTGFRDYLRRRQGKK